MRSKMAAFSGVSRGAATLRAISGGTFQDVSCAAQRICVRIKVRVKVRIRFRVRVRVRLDALA